MFKRVVLIATVGLVSVAGCGAGQEQGPEEENAAPQQTTAEQTQVVEETTMVEERTTEPTTERTAEPTTTEEVSVGGFSVEGPDGGETTVPEVTVEREEVQRYQQQVQPVIEESVSDVSDLIQAEVRRENGNLSLDVDVATLEEARTSVRDGLQRLREIDPPEDLRPVHQQLIESYEQALPAYDEIIEAAESGNPQRMSAAVSENLPRIESFNEETRAILQDLEQATGSR